MTVALTNGLYVLDESGKLSLNFHEGQTRTWQSTARFVLMLAGTQGGKTSFGPWWLWREIMDKGTGDYLAVTTNFDLFRLKMLPEMLRVFVDILGIARWWSGLRVLEIKNPETGKFEAKTINDSMWARIILRSASAPAGLESSTAKGAWLDEVGQPEWDVTHWEAIQRRLSLNEGRVLGTTTAYNSGWLKTSWYDLWKRKEPGYDVVQFASVYNPAFPRTEFDRMKKTAPDWRFKMFYLGDFARPAGLIYNEYNDDTMNVEPFSPDPSWRRVIGLDFGGSNTATLYLVEDPRTHPLTWYVYAEYLEGNQATSDHTKNMRTRLGMAKNFTVCGGAPGETQERMDWNDNSIQVHRPPDEDVEVGISNVIEMFKEGRLKVMSTVTGLRHELATYTRGLDEQGLPTNEIVDKEKFHRLDALRYAVSYIKNTVKVYVSS